MSGATNPQHQTSSAAADLRHISRIVLVTSLYPTSDRPEVGVFVARRVAALRARGVEVRLIASDSYRQGPISRHLGLLLKALRPQGRIEGVEGHVIFPAGFIAVLAARLRHRPCILYAHGADVREAVSSGPLHRSLTKITLRLADRIVANSRSTAALVGSLGGDAVVISPGVDRAEFEPGDRDAARAAVGLPREALIALYLGAIIPRKGADIFAAGVDQAAGWLGVMVGHGELQASIRATHPSIMMFDTVAPNAVPAWIRAADVVVVPSRNEPLGLAAVEALTCGVPVIATAVDGLREIVSDQRNGLLVPAGDAAAIAAGLDALRDRDLRARLGSAARATVSGHDIEQASERMAEVWAALGVRA